MSAQCSSVSTPIHFHNLQVILRHFYMRQAEVLSQCERWKQELAEGIQSMQEAGVTVTHLKELLR